MELHRSLGIALPVIQAPMAGAQDSALAVAVCNAGGLGSLPAAMLDAEGLRRSVAAVRAATDRPFNVNFSCHPVVAPDPAREERWRRVLAPYYRELGLDPTAIPETPVRTPFDAAAAALVEELRPRVVSFHLGLPEPSLLARVRATGATILACATTVAEAQFLARAGVDAVVVQGLEAGGHRSHFLSDDLTLQSGLFALLPQVVAAIDIPVIATGGIADAAGVAGARALGAAMVQVGTAYLLCPEATTRKPHRDALRSESALHTQLTRLFSGGPARGIVNRLMRELGDSAEVPQFPYATTAIAPLRGAAEARGSGDFSPLWCGQNASGCRAVPAAEVTRALAAV
ncbi:MAG: nitronate monooxygenase [Rhizobacter sp.]|nr:nitronate monooxygenase [Rhizobacter sp.]